MPRHKPTIDPALVLDTVPSMNQAVRLETRAEGAVAWIPIQKRWWMGPPFSYLLPYRKERGFALDSLGHQVLLWCDGTRTTEELIERFADRYKLRFHPARLTVLAFLRTLISRNLVVLVARDPSLTQGKEPNPP
jgi:hypothetical protein